MEAMLDTHIKGLLDQRFAPTYDYFTVPTITGALTVDDS